MKTKDLVIIATFVALLIAVQYALSFISGVELVTVLFLAFCYSFGVKRSIITATAFSLLRCFLFGFFPTVIILYLVYYNLFALIVGLIGNKLNREYSIVKHIIMIGVALLLTALFTMLDNIITPLIYAYTLEMAQAYFLASFTTLIPQLICSLATTTLLFFPAFKLLKPLSN